MYAIEHGTDERRLNNGSGASQDVLEAENVSLRLQLAQAKIDAKGLLAQAGIQASEREASDRLQKLILEELHHRIKNTLATVSAIASQSLRDVPGAGQARQALDGRLDALGRAHDLLLQARWTSADLGNVVRSATEAFDKADAARISIAGPDLRLNSGAVIAIAMTLNELCTNATKFGALSQTGGSVDIAWTVDDPSQRLRLTWTEKNGPAVQTPTRRSFGTRLVETLGKQFKGAVELAYEPGGFVYALTAPLAALTSTE